MMNNIRNKLNDILRRDIRDILEKDSIKYHKFNLINTHTNIAMHMVSRHPIVIFDRVLHRHTRLSIILNIRSQ